MGNLAIFTLGPLRVELEGNPTQTSRHKALALLVYLALHPGEQPRDVLSMLFWPEYEQKKASAYLRRTLWEIQNFLGDGWLHADRQAIGFDPDVHFTLDVAEFHAHLTAIQHHTHPNGMPCQECAAHLNTAALLYRGDFLDGFSLRDSAPFEAWQLQQRQVLQSAYARALRTLALLLYQANAFNDATVFTRRWLALDDLNEDAHRLLMKIYAQDGQRHLAVRQYQECRRILQEVLGIPPDPETTALVEAIIAGKFYQPHAPLIPQVAAFNSATSWLGEALSAKAMLADSNLPTPATPFIGRSQELAQVAALLADPACWLLTLVGAGGIGKTRLALQAAQQYSAKATQRAFFISLSAAETESAIVSAMARATGLVFRQNGPAPKQQLLDFLREKPLLLILDSFEGLTQWGGLLEQLHAHAAGIQMLVTSRHRLRLPGEWVLEVKGLHYPGECHADIESAPMEAIQAYSAVELFLEAARRAQIAFKPTQEEFTAIHRITRLLEGMPLALELAAAWINTLTCHEIDVEISRGLDFLETAGWTDPERQHSIRAVFDHSWNLLNPTEQSLLPRLAVFRGSFTRQAAEQVTAISLRVLAGLVEKSIVRRTPQGQYDLHDLQRQYCAEKLAQVPADSLETYDRHCAFYSARLAEWNTALHGERQGQVLRDIETDIENIQAAWRWAVAQQKLALLEQAVEGLGMFYLRRGRFADGVEAYQRAIQSLPSIAPEREKTMHARLSARLRTWQAVFTLNLEQFEQTEQLLQESALILADPQLDPQQLVAERIFMLIIRSILANQRFDRAATLEAYQQAYALSLLSFGKAPLFFTFFWRYLMGGAPSREIYTQIEKIYLELPPGDDPFERGCLLFVLGIAELYHTYRMEKAEPLLMECCHQFQRVDDPSTRVMIFMTLGYLWMVQGRFEDAFALKQRELAVYQDLGDRRMVGIARAEVGEILYHLGRYIEAEDHIRTGITYLQELGEMQTALRQRYLGDVLLAQEKYSQAWQAYDTSCRFFQAVKEPGWAFTAMTGLSRAELALGKRFDAWEHARQALQIYRDAGLYTFFAYLTVAEIALLLAERGEISFALELYGNVNRQGYLAQSRWFAEVYGNRIEALTADLPLQDHSAAMHRSRGMDFSETVEKLLGMLAG
ncbi:MAG: hypothetical protein JW757_14215 [Anaerolineales bacterium]|nr:hypothetical protein [Anaerolineales bacterium]